MRDVGVIIWVALLFIGVVGSMISSLRRQTPSREAPSMPIERSQSVELPGPIELPPQLRRFAVAAPPRPAPQRKPAPVTAPAVPSASSGVIPTLSERSESKWGGANVVEGRARHRLFSDRRDLVRAVIGAEVLGKPRALRDESTPPY